MLNNNGILYISCGVPGSGKSTFLKEMKEKNEIIISRDEIRFALLKPGEDYFSHEKEVYARFLHAIAHNIKMGYNVYADATHLNEKSRYSLLHQLYNKGCRPSETNAIYFDVPLSVCLERNECRLGTAAYVPPEQVERMFTQFVPPQKYEGFKNIWSVNLDGDVELIYEGDDN